MKFGIFYEHQLPRPWEEDDEHKLLKDALEQVELADKLGFDYVWEVEHHFLEEYSHSSAPEVFLAACSQRTRRIRLGHGIVALPHQYNHPFRVAERIANLDLVSDGRVEFGTGETSSESELVAFGIERETKRERWAEALEAITRMFAEAPFAGWDGKAIPSMPVRNVVPKPFQKPHPPLWVACSRRETIHLAAEKGIAALSFSFVEAAEAKDWVDDYYATLDSDARVPGPPRRGGQGQTRAPRTGDRACPCAPLAAVQSAGGVLDPFGDEGLERPADQSASTRRSRATRSSASALAPSCGKTA